MVDKLNGIRNTVQENVNLSIYDKLFNNTYSKVSNKIISYLRISLIDNLYTMGYGYYYEHSIYKSNTIGTKIKNNFIKEII